MNTHSFLPRNAFNLASLSVWSNTEDSRTPCSAFSARTGHPVETTRIILCRHMLKNGSVSVLLIPQHSTSEPAYTPYMPSSFLLALAYQLILLFGILPECECVCKANFKVAAKPFNELKLHLILEELTSKS